MTDVLIEIQRIDDKIARANDTKRKRPADVTARTIERDQQRAKADAARQLVTDTKKRIDALGVESEALRTEIARLDGQLFNLKTNDEFNAMKSQIAQRKEKSGALQDRILELMIALDELKVSAAAQANALAEEEERLKSANARAASDLADADSRIAKLCEQRQEKMAAVPLEIASLYESISARRNGVGIAPLEDEVCRGCDTRVMTQVIARVLAGQLTQCPHCDRILYL